MLVCYTLMLKVWEKIMSKLHGNNKTGNQFCHWHPSVQGCLIWVSCLSALITITTSILILCNYTHASIFCHVAVVYSITDCRHDWQSNRRMKDVLVPACNQRVLPRCLIVCFFVFKADKVDLVPNTLNLWITTKCCSTWLYWVIYLFGQVKLVILTLLYINYIMKKIWWKKWKWPRLKCQGRERIIFAAVFSSCWPT